MENLICQQLSWLVHPILYQLKEFTDMQTIYQCMIGG
jgi:hypothetical protein